MEPRTLPRILRTHGRDQRSSFGYRDSSDRRAARPASARLRTQLLRSRSKPHERRPTHDIFGAGIPYIQRLDYDTNGWFKVLSYLAPQWIFRSDLARFNRKFQASTAPVFLAHLATSDALLHVRTAEQAEPLIIEFENAVSDIYRNAHGELGVILFSDHGDTETLSHEVPVESFLAARGWRIRDSLTAPRDVVIPAYGLVGFAGVYCQPESIERLAEDLRGVQGADLIVSHEPDPNRHHSRGGLGRHSPA